MIDKISHYYIYVIELPLEIKLIFFFFFLAFFALSFRGSKDFKKRTKHLARNDSLKSFWLYLEDEKWPRNVSEMIEIIEKLVQDEKKKNSNTKTIIYKILLKILYWLKLPIYVIFGTIIGVLIFLIMLFLTK